ncbi:hypothetical protein [uncultured Alsobacter sp.]|uniref:hypothetical protein n=1 Tax=uncultured Alsobacter sp. TaxID=1748258 RepID=UPI0025E37C2E|nr:hypothetical protein [uncultured Alsobacter sp.]
MSLRTLILTLAASAFVAGAVGSASAADRQFILPANDGYGIADCLAEGGTCARMVADAWCAAQGMGKALAYGRADAADVTASVSSSRNAPAYTVTCNE